MTVRLAAMPDIPTIVEIGNALVATTTNEWTETLHTEADRAQWLRAKEASGHPVLVAVDDAGAVVGWASYGDFRDSTRWPGYRFTVEHSVHVAEGHRGGGVGRALMAALVDAARAAGKRVMVAAVDAGNDASIAFHAHLGFVEVGHMPGVGEKWGRRLDLVLMQRELSEPLG